MGKKRVLRRTAISTPNSVEELISSVHQIGEQRRTIDIIQAQITNRIERIKAEAGEKIRPHEEAIEQLFEGVYVFAQGHREELTGGGKTKTVKLPTGEVLWRTNPPSVSIRNSEAVVAACEAMGLQRFIRTTKEPDKVAMLKEPDVAAEVKGVKIGQREEFVVKPSVTEVEVARDTKKLQRVLK